MQCCRIVNVIKNKNIKKQPWSNVECFAFGVGIVCFATLETSFHAANHTIPTPPSYEVGGIAKRIKTARLQRKTKPGRDVILHVRL